MNLENLKIQIEEIDVEKLRRTGKDYDFEEIYLKMKEVKESILWICKHEEYTNKLSSFTLNEYDSKITEIIHILRNIRTFNPQNTNPKQNREASITKFETSYHNFYKEIIIPLKIYQLERQNVLNNVVEINSLVDSLNKLKTEFEEKAIEVTVSNYAEIFKIESKDKLKSSKIWLGFGILALASAFAILGILFNYQIEQGKELSFIISKVTVLALLFFAITFLFKQYSINKHLATLNKHRENTLNSYKLFIDGLESGDSDIRNAIMMQVAKSIYEQGRTGYINEKGGEMESPSIIELIRTLPKSDK